VPVAIRPILRWIFLVGLFAASLPDSVQGVPIALTSVSSDQLFLEFPTPTRLSIPLFIVVGPDGNLWFTEYEAGKIGRIRPSNAQILEFPSPHGPVLGIASGSDGSLWFTVSLPEGVIGQMTTDGVVTGFFNVPTFGSLPYAITAGPDGNLWFTESGTNKIGRITTAGVITEFVLPSVPGLPRAITAGPDGNVWFTEQSPYAAVGRITPAGVITEFVISNVGGIGPLAGITSGPDGNLWFTEFGAGKIGRIDTAGNLIGEFVIPTPNSQPLDIAASPDGNLWFTESRVNQIGRVTSYGTFTELAIPTPNSSPSGVVTSLDGNIWFTEASEEVSNVGRLDSALVGPAVTVPTLSSSMLTVLALALAGIGFLVLRAIP
jgi:streptogramin lyase